ncbi:MoaD/ThiS family protein [Nocardioides sp. GY 10113]|uniref:MoaD/ThiS family protein n=1 Tax=Nocardioides sp. GY 10113 TaxID=2569761 RepID=UPI0010A80443|nr:MoaD/ThiS family protein [Nocardioides sp. GY 10113]TIC88367.1 MoaD/ThiS family protein [Nocardioides sp. GY 10113]
MSETQFTQVHYWAAARAAAGTASEGFELPAPVTLAALRAAAVDRHPGRLGDVLGVCSVLLGDQPVGTRDPGDVVVPAGVAVEFLPPFAGG